ncbi:hypothetical protein IE077_001186 [Cardiosporidium cionae]|uniref:BRO1 domain-containing protein n=1 Tax=Cardiosporidium cionae TaxID=476202 RepID=A0ABQ7J5P3_9APIC|nr:hypothetical protein IE077_001186 [Cardiosporidium cionae]|eukprot:KAF8819326.1 hypothetical protein IE077_001186 [Cardiosporidium cionae]
MWSIELKRTETVNIVDPIGRYCKVNYGMGQYDNIQKSLEEANNLRSHFCSLRKLLNYSTGDVSDSVLTALRRYLFICHTLSTRFPFGTHKGMVKLTFKWSDTWKRQDKLISGGIAFEKANVLYNIGAIIANFAFQNSTKKDGMKQALSDLQYAAGLFCFLRDKILPQFPVNMCDDLSSHSINMLINMCIGKSQEMVYEKALLDNLNHSLLSKLSKQASIFYSMAKIEAGRLGTVATPQFNAFSLYDLTYHSVAHYQMVLNDHPAVLKKSEGYGMLIARLRLAVAYCKEACTIFSHSENVITTIDLSQLFGTVSKFLQSLENDNQNCYLESIPNPSTLPELDGASFVKSTPVKWEDIWDSVDAMVEAFDYLVPSHVREKGEQFKATCRSLVSSAKETMLPLQKEMEEFEFVTCTNSKSQILDTLWNRIQTFQNSGGIGITGVNRIDANILHLEEVSRECHKIFENIKESLNLSMPSYNDFAEINKQKGEFMNRVCVLESKVYEANNANRKVRIDFESNSRFLKILTGSRTDLEMASASLSDKSPQSPPLTAAMNGVKQAMETLQSTFKTLEKEVEEQGDKFIQKLIEAGSGENLDSIAENSLRPVSKISNQLKEEIGAFYRAFASAKAVQAAEMGGNNPLEQFQNDVLGSISSLKILQQQLSDGFTFFTQLNNISKTLQQQVIEWTSSPRNS